MRPQRHCSLQHTCSHIADGFDISAQYKAQGGTLWTTAEAAQCRDAQDSAEHLEAVAYLPLVQLPKLWLALLRTLGEAAHMPCNGAILGRMRSCHAARVHCRWCTPQLFQVKGNSAFFMNHGSEYEGIP